MSSYDKLMQNLDRFIRKYYVNKLIRGTLYFIGLVLGVFLIFSLLESVFYFSTGVRKFLFFSFLALFGISLYQWVLDPLFRYFNLGSQISHEQAASIIGDHFTNVKDKLLNILQLRHLAETDSGDHSLIEASIVQKTDEIKVVSFPKAIDLRNNRKHLRFALPPLLILLTFLLAAPSLIKDGSTRILKNNEEFVRPAPFQFVIEADDLEVVQFEDYTLKVNTEGTVMPGEAFIKINDFTYRLSKSDQAGFEYTFRNVKDDVNFTIYSGEVESKPYTLKTLLKPQISELRVSLDYPSYTGRKDEVVQNTGDLVMPEGTEVLWKVDTRNVEQLELLLNKMEQPVLFEKTGPNSYTGKEKIAQSTRYEILINNDFLEAPDRLSYNIQIIPDRYPNIGVTSYVDSSDTRIVYFRGEAEDDYGLRKVLFQYQLRDESGVIVDQGSELLRSAGTRQTSFDYLLDVDSFNLSPGYQLSYYFEAYDNDAINGSKASRTSIMEFRKPSKEEYAEKAEQNSDEIKADLKDILDESKKLKEELKSLREKLLSKKEMTWEDKKELEKLLEKQKALDQQMQDAREKFNENRKNQDEFSNPTEDIQQKQEQLDQIFEESMDQETKDLMEKIEELLQELQREDALEMMEDFNFDQQEMEMNTERLLELYKQLELEQQMMEQQQKLEELAEKQEELSEETQENGQEDKNSQEESTEEDTSDNEQDEDQESEDTGGAQEDQKDKSKQEELQKKQEEIKKEFEKIMEKMDELEEKNEELERPRPMEDTEPTEREVQEQMEQSQQQLQQQQNKKASESQKKAAEKMREMASQMQSSMMNSQMQQMQEDMQALRQLLENLVDLSFDQEDLISSFSRTSAYTPAFVDLVQDQYKIKEDFRMVEDSLRALSKRVSQMESFIIDKVYDVNKNIERSLDRLEERQKTQASDNQRRTMTNLNDLALMLSETMQQMQMQMSSMMPGQQMCKNPGQSGQQGKQPVPGDKMSEGQGELNKEIERWKKAMQQSGKPGPGSKEFAEMAARQAELRKALEDMQKKLTEQGQASEELQDVIDKMNQSETELVNKQLTNETLKRQKEILTRLLEAEKAERERKWDNKREAQTAQEIERKLPPEIEKYLQERESEIEFYQTISPELRPFYRQLVESYYQSLKQR